MNEFNFTLSQIGLILAPPLLLLATFIMFRFVAARHGPARGHLAGFLFYWSTWCFLLPLLTVGPDGFRQMFGSPDPVFGHPNWLGVILLTSPPLFVFLTRFPSEIKSASLSIVIYSALYAIANGTMEEVLWRGTYVVAFPDSWLWAVIYPSFWFGLWHLSPQEIESSEISRGAIAFAVMSIALGLVWGWVAGTTGSIRWTAVSHILLNLAWPAGRWFIPEA